jgi:formylglycine-generating enzyme required for sulfatase activity
MDPLTTALLGALSSAASGITGGEADTAGSDAWAAAKDKLAGWMGFDQRKHGFAFERAARRAVRTFRGNHRPPPEADLILQLFTEDTLEARRFLQVAAEELFWSARPDFGRLLDLYRQDLRFTALLHNTMLPDWETIKPALVLFLRDALPQAMQKELDLRPLLLGQASLHLVDGRYAHRVTAQEQTELLHRINTLLDNMLTQPRIQASITASNGGTIRDAPIQILFGEYRTLPSSSGQELRQLYMRYCDYLRGKYELLDFRGILQVQNVLKLPLEAIYVPLHSSVISSQPRSEYEQLADARDEADLSSIMGQESVTNSVPLHQVIQTTARLIILGDPGSGKSTLVKYVLLSLLRDQGRERLGLTSAWLPILFPVADFAKACEQTPNLSPLDHLCAFYKSESQPDFGQLFERALLSGRALLLFDGLDEVRDSADRLAIVKRLEAFIRTWDLPGNRALATSRIAGYTEAPFSPNLFVQTKVRAFSDGDIRQFAAKWSAAYERAGWEEGVSEVELARKSSEHEHALMSAIAGNEQAAELARNPLLLTMLALIHIQGVTLPSRRVELYELCIKALAETWSHARSLSGRPIDVYLKHNHQKLDEGFVVNLLGPTALWIHTEQPGGLVEHLDLERQLAKIFRETYNKSQGDARDLARDFLELVEEQTGLLQARGKNLYGFLHLTLEEYLAARALLDQRFDTPNLLQQYTNQPGWREVIRLCVASIREVRGTQRALSELLATPTDTQTRSIPAIRAGECLLDLGATGTTHQAHHQVITALLTALVDPQTPNVTRVEAGEVLSRLGDPRLLDPTTGEAIGLGDYDAVESYWCAIEHGTFWFGDEQVDRPQPGNRSKSLSKKLLFRYALQATQDAKNRILSRQLAISKGARPTFTRTDIRRDASTRPPRFDPAKLSQVELPYDYQIGRYPVTNAEFAHFLEANGPDGYDPAKPWWTEQGKRFLYPGGHRYDLQAEFIALPRLWDDPRYNGPSQPVVGVSWYEAAAYCRWLTEQGHARGWLPPDRVIRLPTSLEWERAARHTDPRPFPWGDATPTPQHANYADAGVGAPSPAGCFPAGRAVCGADDLLGNVLEWLSTPTGAESDPHAREDFTPDSGVELSFTLYNDGLDQMCCGARYWFYPFNRNLVRSFRVVRSPIFAE